MLNFKSSALALLLGASSLAALSTAAFSQAAIDISVSVAPPLRDNPEVELTYCP